MPRSYKVFGFLLVALLGVYGCSKGPTSSAPPDTSAATAKLQKLEEEYKAAAAARDQLRQKLASAEDQQTKAQAAQAQLQQQLEETKVAAEKEKDALKNEVKARTGERDAVNAQYESFRKNLKQLIGSADGAIGALNLPAPKPAADQGAQK